MKNEIRDDVLMIIDLISADMAEDIWVASEYPDFDIRKLYVYPDKQLKELRDRIETLWGGDDV